MTRHGARGRVARRAGWLACLVLTLGGLLGMHGLETHGAAMSRSAAHSSMTSAVQRVAVGVETVAGPHAGDGMDMGTACMCMAVLGLVLLLLTASRGRRVIHQPRALLAGAARAPTYRGRDPDPPSLERLSVRRC